MTIHWHRIAPAEYKRLWDALDGCVGLRVHASTGDDEGLMTQWAITGTSLPCLRWTKTGATERHFIAMYLD